MPSPRPHHPSVIIVEDDADLLEALRYMLEIDGFNVVTCSSGEMLLDLTLPKTQACLVVDQILPGISGIQALEVLRERNVELPAVIITGAPNALLRARTLVANARLVEKPLLNDLLIEVIRELV